MLRVFVIILTTSNSRDYLQQSTWSAPDNMALLNGWFHVPHPFAEVKIRSQNPKTERHAVSLRTMWIQSVSMPIPTSLIST